MDIETKNGQRPFEKTGREIIEQAERVTGALRAQQEEARIDVEAAATRRQMGRDEFLRHAGIDVMQMEYVDRYIGTAESFSRFPGEDGLVQAIERFVRLQQRLNVITRVARNVRSEETYRLDYSELVTFGF